MQRRRFTKVLLAGALLALAQLSPVGFAPAARAAGVRIPLAPYTECPPVGGSPSCGILVVVNPDRSVFVYGDSSVRSYDGIEDTLVGVRNDSTSPISAITVTGSGTALAGLDGDGLCTFGIVGCPFGPTGYEGPNTKIITLPGVVDSAEIDFPSQLAAGSSTYFSLEGILTSASLKAREGQLGGYLSPPAVNLPGGQWTAHWPCTTASVSLALQSADGTVLDAGFGFLVNGLPVSGDSQNYVEGFTAGAPGDYVAVLSCGSSAIKLPFTVKGASYVALGDSFSSGEGASAFINGTGTPTDIVGGTNPGGNLCHRATNGFVMRAAAAKNVSLDFAACSGAGIDDLFKRNAMNGDQIAQLAHLAAAGHNRADVSLVTLSIGINDLGFDEVLTDCVDVPPLAAWIGPHGKFGCADRNGTLMDRALSFLAEGMPAGTFDLPGINKLGNHDGVTGPKPALADIYAEIHRRAPNARILVLGYPELWGDSFESFPAPGRKVCHVGTAFGSVNLNVAWPDSRWMNGVSKNLNSVIRDGIATAAGAGANVKFVDTTSAFAPSKQLDYRLCASSGPRFRALDLHGQDPLMVSFHPNDAGQEAIANLVIPSA